ncbi:oligosaccharyltransferase complex subunit-like protein [Raphidocelis subcapitata]|uniref:Oligosaccharyltransferase complex subunit-like protein n=1 Tax=Raphidocelis subcapitata TaxID=307507 RepID=A0A2V0NZA7_9CHLO|nr:oligosaccharyltransferase complex subunit-like protein [Raphidocelis subcapitata]|eukprot:GBF90257.1 oligosaccharyltransferase complex subunit-like protein [Raphidocelis subcapitata]
MGAIVTKVEQMELPRASTVCALALVSYFFITCGVAYDIIQEPPAVGAEKDPVTGRLKAVMFMPYRINGQYTMEGMAGGLMYSMGGLGLIVLDMAHRRDMEAKYRKVLMAMGGAMVLVGYFAVMAFLRIKMPSYLARVHEGW